MFRDEFLTEYNGYRLESMEIPIKLGFSVSSTIEYQNQNYTNNKNTNDKNSKSIPLKNRISGYYD